MTEPEDLQEENGHIEEKKSGKKEKREKRHKKEKKHKHKKEKKRSSDQAKPEKSNSPESGEIDDPQHLEDVESKEPDQLLPINESGLKRGLEESAPEAQAIGRIEKRQKVEGSPSRDLDAVHKDPSDVQLQEQSKDASPESRSKSNVEDASTRSPKKNGTDDALKQEDTKNHGSEINYKEHPSRGEPPNDRHTKDSSHRSRSPSRRRSDERDRSKVSRDSRKRIRSPARRSKSRPHRSRSPIHRSLSRRDRSSSPMKRRSPRREDRDRSTNRYRDDRRLDRRDTRRDDRRDVLRPRDSRRSRSPRRYDTRDRRRSPSRNRDRNRRDRVRDERRESEKREERKKSRERDDKEFAEKVLAQLEETQVDEDELIEQRRRKRLELQKKLKEEKHAAESVANPTASELGNSQILNLQSVPASPSIQNNDPTENGTHIDPNLTPQKSTAATAMDSDTEDEDMEEIEEANLFRSENDRRSPEINQSRAPTPSEASSDERHKVENQEKKDQAGGFDMFMLDALDDSVLNDTVPQGGQAAGKHGLLDQFDDSDGYYNFQVGEVLNRRYEVFATHGKGVFSTVLRARDLHPVDIKGSPIPVVGNIYPEVAIKVIRSNEIMTKAGHAEEVILQKLAGADPSNKYHVIRLLGSFRYRGHLCLVFEPLESNLRQLTKKYGQNIGLRLDAVRSMSAQMLMALHLMKQCGVLHADIKPDNILINKGHNVVKICDFGSAMFTGTNEITPYLVSRYYRSPEIILGLHYDHPLDVWSIGCVVYELFTGKILFPGRTNNEMLKLIMDLKGPFPKKMLKKGQFTNLHFEDDPNMSFCQMEVDSLTKRPVRRLVPNPTIKKDFKARLAGQEGGPQLANLVDFLEKMLHLDPEKRITAKEALRHPFIKAGRPQTK